MKLNILFVDDEANVIRGLKRMLRVLREDWEFFFALSGNEALKIMETTPMVIIVSDMRMPQMNGAELLEIVKEKYPSTIRMILSGQSNEELALKSTRLAHKFISKPIEPEKLKETIQLSLKLHKLLNNENLRKIINGVNRLPSIPQTYLEIEKELAKDTFSLNTITKIIGNDPIMTAKILQIVNSAFFGLSRNISDITQSVNLIGADTIKSLILCVQVFKSYKGSPKVEQLLNKIWEHSLRVANSAKNIILKFGNNPKDSEATYISGLLHDIGKIIILDTESFRNNIFTLMDKDKVTYNEAEKIVLGTTHAEVGGYLLRLWGLPEIVVESALSHHNKDVFMKKEIDVSVAINLANIFVEEPNVDSEIIKNCSYSEKLPEIIEICNRNIEGDKKWTKYF